MARLDRAALALGLDRLAAGVGDNILDAGARMDDDTAPVGVPVRAAERGPAVLDPIEAALGEPSRKVELGGVLAVRMDPDLPDRLRLEQVHGVGKHDGAFEEVPVRLVRWRACRRR